MTQKCLALSSSKGFTIIEMLIVVTILMVLVAMAVQPFFTIKKATDVDTAAEEFMGVVKLAQSRTVSSENSVQYGVYLNTSSLPNQYIMFKGASYATRDTTADVTYLLPNTVQFSGVSLGSVNQIVFDKLTGASEESGTISIRSKVDNSQSKTMYVTSSGVINSASTAPLDDNRVKDSRHIQFDYSRIINTSTESVVLYFDNTVTESIPMSENLTNGQFQWSGTVTVGGVGQTVSVITHRLNNPDTEFSIHRDGRYNTKSLKVSISGDASGYLVNYSADGLTTTHTSTYISNFAWQ